MKRYKLFPGGARASLVRFAALVLLAIAARTAGAQVIDSVELKRAGGETEIHIKFVSTVQYLRHYPQSDNEFVRIQFAFTGSPLGAVTQTRFESYRPPTNGLLDPITVSYPEEDRTLQIRFSKRTKFRVRPAADGRGFLVYVPFEQPAGVVPVQPLGGGPAVAPPSPAHVDTPAKSEAGAPALALPGSPAEIESAAATLLMQAKDALARGDATAAIEALNRLLNLPPARTSQEAQELIGEARARNGEISKARSEYDLYLKLYPDGEGAARVRKRLAALPKEAPVVAGARQTLRPEKREVTTFGNFFQSYYYGSSKFDSTLVPATPGLKFDQSSLTATDQSSLVSSLDLTTRIRAPTYDGKFVVRDIFTKNNLAGQSDTNRLYAAYYEHLTSDNAFLGRVGRQPGFSSGILGIYDGVWAGYRVLPMARVNVVAGVPVDFFPTPNKHFYGLSADIGPWRDSWSSNLYVIEQRVGSVVDRRATGGELRYFGPRSNLLGLVDYDVQFKALNLATAQGNWLAESGTNYTFMLDHRRVPFLQISNSLIAESSTLPGISTPNVAQLLQSGRVVADLRQEARAVTPISDLLLVGVNHPITPTLQLGGDFRISTVSGTDAAGILPAMPGTGRIYVYSGQAIKTALFTPNGTGVVNLSIIDGATYNGRSATFNYVLLTGGKWRTEGALSYYQQHTNLDVSLKRIAPALRLEYRQRANLTFQFEGGLESTNTDSALQHDKTLRKYFNLGWRWDLQ